MSPLMAALVYAFLGGVAMPIGAALARAEHIRPARLEANILHGIVAFGGGALLAAVALVLVPEGMERLSIFPALLAFGTGGVVFCLIDRMIAMRGGSSAQLLAMLVDFIPESMALGAMLTVSPEAGLLLAGLIAVQNLPEGFNAYRELRGSTALSPGRIILIFSALALLGPASAWIGYSFLSEGPQALGAVMLFAGGGILYLIFEDIAPQTPLEAAWSPPLGAVGGFLLGMAGHALVS